MVASEKVIIWGSRRKNVCQEQDLKAAFEAEGMDVKIWTPKTAGTDPEGATVLIRNLFYSYMKTGYDPANEPDVIKQLRALEAQTPFAQSIDALITARDKVATDAVLRDLGIPHIRTYNLDNDPRALVEWINTNEQFSDGVIIKDRFGGRGKGIVRVKRQGALYLCDFSAVDGMEQTYVNETMSADELAGVFGRHMGGYVLIGQAYVKSSREFQTGIESESIRIVQIGEDHYLAMCRRAECPINNLSLTKENPVKGGAVVTEATAEEIEWGNRISRSMGLFLAGHDMIRTDPRYFADMPSALYIPPGFEPQGDTVSLVLEVNANVQFGGIQELYGGEHNIARYVAQSLQRRMRQ